jgi:hypothetical protein
MRRIHLSDFIDISIPYLFNLHRRGAKDAKKSQMTETEDRRDDSAIVFICWLCGFYIQLMIDLSLVFFASFASLR